MKMICLLNWKFQYLELKYPAPPRPPRTHTQKFPTIKCIPFSDFMRLIGWIELLQLWRVKNAVGPEANHPGYL